jgi:DNA-binding CsgD family transcriptional regulator
VKSLLAKLDAHSQLEAVAKAMRHGLIDAYAQS